MQTRVMALREQRTYLNDQLKLTMKRSRVLEASVKNEQISEAEPARGMSQHFFLPPAQTEVPILQNVSTLSQQPVRVCILDINFNSCLLLLFW